VCVCVWEAACVMVWEAACGIVWEAAPRYSSQFLSKYLTPVRPAGGPKSNLRAH
jgi:hypothetical protein